MRTLCTKGISEGYGYVHPQYRLWDMFTLPEYLLTVKDLKPKCEKDGRDIPTLFISIMERMDSNIWEG